jgi:hypothetical protein
MAKTINRVNPPEQIQATMIYTTPNQFSFIIFPNLNVKKIEFKIKIA